MNDSPIGHSRPLAVRGTTEGEGPVGKGDLVVVGIAEIVEDQDVGELGGDANRQVIGEDAVNAPDLLAGVVVNPEPVPCH